MAEYILPEKNVEYIFYTALTTAGSTALKAAPTIAAGDFKVSTDGGAFANLTTLPTVTPAAGVMVKITLSASEMNGDNVVVQCIDAAGAEWEDQVIPIHTATRPLEDLAFPTVAGRSLDVTATGAAGIDWGNVENPTTAVDLSGTDIQLCDTVTTNTDMRGTDSAALASVATEARLAELDAANLPADIDTLLGRVTSTIFSGITSLAEWLGLMAGKQTANATALAEIQATGAGSGTYNEATDSQEVLGEKALANQTAIGTIDTVVDAIKVVTDVIPDSGAMTSIAQASALATVDTVVDAIKVIADALGATAASRLALSAGAMVPFTVDTATNGHTPTTTEFQADDVTEATADHFNGRLVVWTSGALQNQVTDVTDYVAVGGIGQFTVTALTEAPSDNDTGILV